MAHQVICTMTGELARVYSAIIAGDDLSYQELAAAADVPVSKAHYYANALKDLNLVEIVDGRKPGRFMRKWIRVKK